MQDKFDKLIADTRQSEGYKDAEIFKQQHERIDALYKDPFGNEYDLSGLRNIAARLREVRNGDSVVMEHLFPTRSPDMFADTDHSYSVTRRRYYKSELPRIEKRISELESERKEAEKKHDIRT